MPGEEVGIPCMKANRWFIQDVECADQPGTQLICQRNSLRLTTGQRLGLPVERQIPKANTLEKAQLCRELPEDIRRDFLFELAQGQGVHPFCKTFHSSFRGLVNIAAGELDEARVWFQAAAMATGAVDGCPIAAEKDSDVQFIPLALEVLEEVVDAIE